jgi:NADH-quinone oxidoreductase subunit L
MAGGRLMPVPYFLDHIWLIPLFPLASAALMLLFGRKLPHAAVSTVCVGSVLLSFIYVLGASLALIGLPPESRVFEKILFQWIPGGAYHTAAGGLGRFVADWGFRFDPLTVVMVLIVTGVGSLIHFYSIGYMAHEGGYYRFFGYMNLFMFSMLMLVLANNLLLMFVGWEGVGTCSYLLIGFYFRRKSAGDAGKKAFIVNRIGDAGFLLGLFLISMTLGTIRFDEFPAALAAGHFAVGASVLTAATLLLFVGAMGKSAQIPLYVWLPDAMEGPTPVSALIHAATMVTAGVYMVVRNNALFQLAPVTTGVIAVIGAMTALFAATIALVQNDIKKVLAYSTISQLGYMFLACGVGAFTAGIFHVMTHAFFKALLFLGAGSVIHAMSGEQDMRKMGGLAKKVPITHATMLAATLAIAGIPPLAGFFSKDKILSHAFGYNRALWFVGWLTAGLTAFYMFRLLFLTFHGKSHVSYEAEHHLHESPPAMTGPLIILAVLSIGGGWIGLGGRFDHFLEPVVHFIPAAAEAAASSATEYILMAASVFAGIAGIAVAWHLHLRDPELSDRMAERSGWLYRLLFHKYYVDEVYDAVFVNRTKDLANTLAAFDSTVIDGAGVNGSAWLVRVISRISIWWDTWIVDGSVRFGFRFVWLLSFPVRMLQSGLVQGYLLLMVCGILGLFGYYLYLFRH